MIAEYSQETWADFFQPTFKQYPALEKMPGGDNRLLSYFAEVAERFHAA